MFIINRDHPQNNGRPNITKQTLMDYLRSKKFNNLLRDEGHNILEVDIINGIEGRTNEIFRYLYKDITIDRQMLKDLEDAMNKDMFQHIYMSTDLYINLHRFCEEMNLAFDSTFDSLFENSIQSLKEAKIVIQAEGEVE